MEAGTKNQIRTLFRPRRCGDRGAVVDADASKARQLQRRVAQVETGAIELSLRDRGVVDLVVAQFARMQNVSRDAARSALVEIIRAQGEKVAASNLDAKAAVDALTGFVATSGQTLTIKLTPFGKLPLLQLIDVLDHEPIIALAQFRIEASTGL